MKKMVLLGIALIMGLSLAACNGGEVSLAKYKKTAKTELDTYVAALSKDDYEHEYWEEVLSALADGKSVIDAAVDTLGVDAGKAVALQRINYVCLSSQIIPYKTRSEINRLYVKWFTDDDYKPTIEEVSQRVIACYYGQYNGFYVFHFSGWGFSFSNTTIDDLIFTTHDFTGILALSEEYGGERKPGEIHENVLKQVYEKGYISRKDLETIYEINLTYCNAR